jgi:hypothetical protein
VCKPCWELKYCPYGPLVEFFPLSPERISMQSIQRRYRKLVRDFEKGTLKDHYYAEDAAQAIEFFQPSRWAWIKQFRSEELACNVFGHICPVFFAWESFSETKTGRATGRTIPRSVMLKVIRRDGQICQICQIPVKDDEVEFDHVIPFSRGGPMTTENLRLVCRPCNRKKRDSLEELLWQRDRGLTSR